MERLPKTKATPPTREGHLLRGRIPSLRERAAGKEEGAVLEIPLGDVNPEADGSRGYARRDLRPRPPALPPQGRNRWRRGRRAGACGPTYMSPKIPANVLRRFLMVSSGSSDFSLDWLSRRNREAGPPWGLCGGGGGLPAPEEPLCRRCGSAGIGPRGCGGGPGGGPDGGPPTDCSTEDVRSRRRRPRWQCGTEENGAERTKVRNGCRAFPTENTEIKPGWSEQL